MLKIMRADVARSREMCIDRIGRELSEKQRKLEQYEIILNEPTMSNQEMEQMTIEKRRMEKESKDLEDRMAKGNPNDDKLAIYKQQVALVSKKKEKLGDNLKDLEEEKDKLERNLSAKENEYKQMHGPK